MKLISIFDYSYLRIYGFFKERGDNIAETSAALIIALIQFLTILDLVIIGAMVFDYSLPSSKYYFLPLIVLLGVMNWYRYEKKLNLKKLIVQWQNEDKQKSTRNGWLIIVYLLCSAAIPVLYGMITHEQI